MKTVLTEHQIREICRAYENGEVKRTIYERYSISQKRLEEILKERKAVRKIPVKPKGRVSQNTKNKHSLYNVCKKVGCHKNDTSGNYSSKDGTTIPEWISGCKQRPQMAGERTGNFLGIAGIERKMRDRKNE